MIIVWRTVVVLICNSGNGDCFIFIKFECVFIVIEMRRNVNFNPSVLAFYDRYISTGAEPEILNFTFPVIYILHR